MKASGEMKVAYGELIKKCLPLSQSFSSFGVSCSIPRWKESVIELLSNKRNRKTQLRSTLYSIPIHMDDQDSNLCLCAHTQFLCTFDWSWSESSKRPKKQACIIYWKMTYKTVFFIIFWRGLKCGLQVTWLARCWTSCLLLLAQQSLYFLCRTKVLRTQAAIPCDPELLIGQYMELLTLQKEGEALTSYQQKQ